MKAARIIVAPCWANVFGSAYGFAASGAPSVSRLGVGRTSHCRYPPPLWIGILAITVFFADISITGTLQPFYIDEVLHAGVEWVGVAITAQFACATVGQFLTGLLADAVGLRRTVIFVCAANVALLNLVGRTRSIAELLAVRCLLGLASTYALALSWVASLAPRARLARWTSATVLYHLRLQPPSPTATAFITYG